MGTCASPAQQRAAPGTLASPPAGRAASRCPGSRGQRLHPMTILDDIVSRTRARLGSEPPLDRAAAETAARNRPPFALTAALRRDRINVIAEIKSASPSAGSIVENPDVETIARTYKQGGAAAISVVTEPEFFHGSREWIARAAAASGLPILMKDFVIDESQLIRGIAAGASAILLLASLL